MEKSIQRLSAQLSEIDKKMDTMKSDIDTMKSDIDKRFDAQVSDIEKLCEHICDVKIDSLSATVDKKLQDIKDDIAKSSAKGIVKKYQAAIEGLNNYQQGIFLPDILTQFSASNSDKFLSIFRGKVDSLNAFQLAEYGVQFLADVLGNVGQNNRQVALLLVDRVLLDSAYVIGKQQKHLLLRFSTIAAAQTFRTSLDDFNKQQTATKRPLLRFSRLRTNIESVDKALAIGKSVLFFAKKNDLIKSFHISPKISADLGSLSNTSRVRYAGDSGWETIHWSTQSPEVAKTDLLKLLLNPDPVKVKLFEKNVQELADRLASDSTETPRTQRRRNPPPTA